MRFIKNINSLWYVYLFAILLIAAFLSSVFFISEYNKQLSIENERIVNIAGRQRMLSQRLALFVNLYMTKDEQAELYRERIQKSLNLFMKSHFALLNGSRDLNITDKAGMVAEHIYFGEPQLDRLVSEYAARIQTIIKDQVPDKAVLKTINNMAEGRLLQYLDKVVNAIETHAIKESEKLILYERVFFFMAMFLLFCEFMLIYRPSFLFLKDYDQKLRNEKAKLKATNKELEQFAYRTSHDFRSPIISNISLLQYCEKFIERGDTDKLKESLSLVTRSLKNLENLMNEVIMITLIQKQEEKVETFSLQELTNEVIESVKTFEGYEEITLHNEVENITVTNKRRALNIALSNLLTNAVKYRDPKKNGPYIRINSEIDGNKLVIKIIDNGLGIDEEFRDKLFEMFQRFHPSVSFGTGLGLHIVKNSVDNLGGDIVFSQNPDTCFEIRMPFKDG